MQLRDTWLLLLRVLAVLLIVGAFSWPHLHRRNTLTVRESVVYILDNTLSHQANNGFKTDRNRIVEELGNAGPDVQLAVIELTSTPRVVASFGDDRAAARQKVQALEPSFQRGSYLAAFREANSLLDNSLTQKKRIALLADNQANQWDENIKTPPFLKNVQLDLPKPASEQLPNLWLSDLRAQWIFLGEKSMLNFTLRLGHLGSAREAKVVLRLDEKVVFNRTVDLEKQPKNILLQAQCEADPTSWVRAEASASGTPDALEGDNHVYCSLAPVEEGRVALLAQSPYLRLALSPEVMRGQWSTRLLEPSKLAEAVSGEDADVLCLESSYLQSAEARNLVKRYLAEDRGVLLLVNRLSPVIDGCLRELGFEPEGMLEPRESKSEQFQFVFSNHPIFHPFRSPDFGNLMDIRISQHARLRATAGRPLILSETGAGLFFESTRRPGKLFLCAFGLDKGQTTWPIHPTFIPFLDLTLQAARPQDPSSTTFQPGEATTIQAPAGASPHEVVLRDDVHEVARASLVRGRAQVRMPATPGLYSMTFDAEKRIQRVFSVNSPAKESELAFADSPMPVREWSYNSERPAKSSMSEGQTEVGFSGILQQRLWWWMVLGGLLVLTFETVLAQAKGERREF